MYDTPGEFLKAVDLGTVGAVRQYSGPRQETHVKPYTITQQNLPYELTMQIDCEDVNRDYLGMFETKAAEMGAKFADHITKLVIAQTLANPNSFDGTAFFGTHVVGANSIINDLTATQCPGLAAGVAAAPTVVEAATFITQVLGWFYTFLDEAGDPINGSAQVHDRDLEPGRLRGDQRRDL